VSRARHLAAAAVVLVATACPGGPGEPRGASPIQVVRFDLDSELLGRTLHEVGLRPLPLASGAARPLLVFLHGRGASPDRIIEEQDLDTALESLGDDAPAVVLVDGGASSYYHDRDDGPWGTHVLDEVIPEAIRRLGADADRVAIGGESMGGFGALDLGRLWPERFCAVGAHSAALWPTGGETPAGSFDDAEDFARHDLLADSDPFRAADTAFAGLLTRGDGEVRFEVRPGAHGDPYWARNLGDYLAFYVRSLAACGRAVET
jgi:enterochelin esterase-like enzyme